MLRVEEFESVLRHHVLDVWFPRSIDREYGGFLCDFDRAWKPCGPQHKLLEFQARHTLAAADAARAFPDHPGLEEAARHGFRFLRDVLWDHDAGGWYHLLDRAGRPLEAATKHTHGFAYAIPACVAVHALTGDPDALALARDAFAWIDRHAYDREHGGYFGFLTRDGNVIAEPSQCPWNSDLDTVGTEIGLKDLNVHSDFLEGLALLYRACRDALLGERLREMIGIVADRMTNPHNGATYFFTTRDWRPVPHFVRVGYQLHTAYRLMLAGHLTGDAQRVAPVALRIVGNAIRCGYDSDEGGFYYAVPGAWPLDLHARDIRLRLKLWWVQAEGLRGLLTAHRLAPDDDRYLRYFEQTWRYVRRHLVDRRYGGVYSFGLDGVRRWERRLGARLAPAWVTRKGDVWKDAAHEGRALLYCIESLRDAPV